MSILMKGERNMKKKILAMAMVAVMALGVTGCESWDRFKKDMGSDFGGGLDRKVTAYDYNGNILYEYEGKIDIRVSETRVLFDTEEGKRVILYNAIVVTEEQ